MSVLVYQRGRSAFDQLVLDRSLWLWISYRPRVLPTRLITEHCHRPHRQQNCPDAKWPHSATGKSIKDMDRTLSVEAGDRSEIPHHLLLCPEPRPAATEKRYVPAMRRSQQCDPRIPFERIHFKRPERDEGIVLGM